MVDEDVTRASPLQRGRYVFPDWEGSYITYYSYIYVGCTHNTHVVVGVT